MSAVTARHAGIADIMTTLQDRKALSRDLVVPATKLRAVNGVIRVKGSGAVEITKEGVTTLDGLYAPTDVFNEGLATKLDVPVSYLKRVHATATDIYDYVVNAHLHGKAIVRGGGEREVLRPADDRKFLLRLLASDSRTGVARAFLSDSFKAIDDLDVLLAGLEGIHESVVDPGGLVVTGDLTSRRMYLDVYAPSVSALAPVLLSGYRSPFSGPNAERRAGGTTIADLDAPRDFGHGTVEHPLVFAGWRITNSEVGNGRASVTPRIVVQACANGMLITSDRVAYRHSGAKLDEGRVDWSAETYRKNLELVTSETKDAVVRFMSPGYLAEQVAKIEARAGRPITQPEAQVAEVTKSLGFTKAEAAGVLRHFIKGGQDTAGGLLNAITSYSQTLADADRAAELDESALAVLDRV